MIYCNTIAVLLGYVPTITCNAWKILKFIIHYLKYSKNRPFDDAIVSKSAEYISV